jgi:hypothetical protein
MGIEMSFSTGDPLGVCPISIPAMAQSSPQFETDTLIACVTSRVVSFASHRYS